MLCSKVPAPPTFDALFEGASSTHLEGEIDAACCLADVLAPVWGALVVDDLVRTQGAQTVSFRVLAGGDGHVRARGLG